jgi:hypothetical protein
LWCDRSWSRVSLVPQHMEAPPTLPPPTGPVPATMPLSARLLNIFAAPGEVFDAVKPAGRSAANWLVPVLLSCVVGVASSIAIMSQPGFQHQIREQQAKAMDKLIEAGKMSQADADRALAVAERFSGPAVMMVFGSIAAVFYAFGRVFWWALMLWLAGRWFLKRRFGYVKAVEVAGLATMVSVLGAVVTVLLTLSLDRMFATPSLALLVSEFDPANKTHLLLGAANFLNLWLAGVMAVGLAKLAGVAFHKAALVVFSFWVALELGLIFVGLGQLAL